jgi:hypothetical protein
MSKATTHEGVRRMRFVSLLDRQEQGEITQAEAAEILGTTVRAFQRWVDRYRDEGEEGQCYASTYRLDTCAGLIDKAGIGDAGTPRRHRCRHAPSWMLFAKYLGLRSSRHQYANCCPFTQSRSYCRKLFGSCRQLGTDPGNDWPPLCSFSLPVGRKQVLQLAAQIREL